MKKFIVEGMVVLFLSLIMSIGVFVKADDFTDVGRLYDKAVSENIIDPRLYPKSAWERDEQNQMKPSYELYKQTVSQSTTYEE